MYIIDKFRPTKLSCVLLSFFFLTVFTSPVAAVDLPFDPNDFAFLVYNPGGTQSRIVEAMSRLGITYEERDPSNDVTINDLSTHDILIVGWNDDGNTAGLTENVLAAGITGRVILTGHDADFHTVRDNQFAELFLVQAIDWVLKGDGTGLITLGCTDAFPYLPEFWDVNAYFNNGNYVNEFTGEGLASGVYDDLVPDDMDNWGASYHDIFTIEQDSYFVPFELGGYDGNDIITIASYKFKLPYFSIHKDANGVNCVSPLISQAEHEFMETPYNWLYYNIDCNAIGYADTNVFITDHLPAEVNYISSSSDPCGIYDPCERTVTWDIGDISASYSNTFWIQVGVNYYAKPGHKIINLCEMEGDLYYKFTTLETDVCCYGVNIIYVDADANDPNSYHNGTSWLHAYKDLQEALHTARTCGCEQIWVAKGTYKPAKLSRSVSFELVDNVAVYGGFPPGGGTWPQRNPNVYETILSGDIAAPNDLSDNSYHVVKCQDINNAILDGFTITAGNADVDNSDPCCGGGIYNYNSSSLTIRYCTFRENSAGYGAAVFNNSSEVNISNCILNDNTANWWGGAMYNCYEPSPAMVACVFRDNTAEYNGGGMYNHESSPTIINCTFSGNSATTVGNSFGGAIYNIYSSDPNITNCTFANNSAREGGAVYNYYDSGPNIINCFFNGNTAISYGGSMVNSNESSPSIINCTFSGNSATTVGNSFGGAICNWINSDPNVINCTFIDNSAHEGGGLYNKSSDPNIANCIFTANDANMGGGLCNTSSEPNIMNCVFTGNIADSNGGGMYNRDYSSVIVSNCIFSGNRANEYGGGMTNDYSGVLLTNCTFSGNWAYFGGGMLNLDSNVQVDNCILWANVAGIDYNEIFIDDPNTVIISYSDIEDSNGSGSYWDENFGMDGGYNIDEDPCFFEVNQPDGSWTEDVFYESSTFQSTLTDANANWAVNELAGKFVNPYVYIYQHLQFFIVSNDVNTIKVWSDVNNIAGKGDTYYIYDYHLRVDSPCVDRGDPNGDYTGQKDIDGEPRVFDGDANEIPIVDMGADEYYWSPADINSDGFVNFFDYTFFASAWRSDPCDNNYNEDCDLEVNNSIDYNDIALFCEDWLWQTAWAKAFPCAYDEGWGRSMGMGMGESFFPSKQARQIQPQLTAADIEEILKWLAELWLTDDEVRKVINEDEWLKFIEAVIQAAKEQIYN